MQDFDLCIQGMYNWARVYLKSTPGLSSLRGQGQKEIMFNCSTVSLVIYTTPLSLKIY